MKSTGKLILSLLPVVNSQILSSEHKWMNPEDILQGEFHPALKQSVSDLMKQREWEKLKTIAATSSDEELGKQFKLFLKNL